MTLFAQRRRLRMNEEGLGLNEKKGLANEGKKISVFLKQFI